MKVSKILRHKTIFFCKLTFRNLATFFGWLTSDQAIFFVSKREEKLKLKKNVSKLIRLDRLKKSAILANWQKKLFLHL